MFVITGATGRSGKKAVESLIKSGQKVKAIGRSADKLQSLKDLGAEIALGSLNDTEFLAKEFEGATGVYAMIPPNNYSDNFRKYQQEIAKSITDAISKSKVKNVVLLSSIGAHLPEKTGVVNGLYDFEQMLNGLDDVNSVYLRAGYFYQNLFGQLGTIKNMGISGSPINGDAPMPMVHVDDIGVVAAEELINLSENKSNGKNIRYLASEKSHSYNDVTSLLGKALGIENLQYVQFPLDDAKKAMIGMGMSEDFSSSMMEFCQAGNDGLIVSDIKNSTYKPTPTKLEDFISHEFTHAYKSM